MLALFVMAIFAEDATEEHKAAMKGFQKSIGMVRKGVDVPTAIATIKASAKTVEDFWLKRDPEVTTKSLKAINDGLEAAGKAGEDPAALAAAAATIQGSCAGCHSVHKGEGNSIK
jgi:cytochrome c556